MKTLYETIQDIKKDNLSSMDYDEDFMTVQKILSTFNDHIKPFRKMQMRQGNERYMKELSNRLQSFLLQKGYLDKTSNFDLKLLKIAFYLVLNSEISPECGLENEERVCHLIGNFPSIPKCTLFHLIWEQKLSTYFWDFLSYSPSWLVVELLDNEIADSWKPLQRSAVIENTCSLISAIYKHIFLLSFIEEESDTFGPNLEGFLKRMTDFLVGIISQNFSITDSDEDNFNLTIGQILKHFISSLITCFELFFSKSAINFSLDRFNLLQTNNSRRLNLNKKTPLREELTILNEKLLNHLQMVVESITLDIFIDLDEIEVTKTLSYQRCVGELAFKFHETLQSDPELNHDVISRLKAISIKPIETADIIKDSTIGEIISNLNGAESDKLPWIEELISRGELVFDNEECLQVVHTQCHLLSLKHVKTMLEYLKSNIGNELDFGDQVLEMILTLICREEDLSIVDDFLQNEEPYRIFADFELNIDPYFTQLIVFFNKTTIINLEITSKSLSPFLKAMTISPEKSISELLRICLNDQSQLECAVRIMQSIKGVSSCFIEDIILDYFKLKFEEMPKEMELFLWKMFEAKFVDSNHFVKDIIFANLTEFVESESKEREILLLLNVLKRIVLSGFKINRDISIPILIGIGLVADKFRWDLISYSDLKIRIVDCSLIIIEKLCETTKEDISSKHKKWIEMKTQSMKPLTQFYFQPILSEATKDLVSFLQPNGFQTEREKVEFLAKMFVRCTPKEVDLLVDNEKLATSYFEMIQKLIAFSSKTDCKLGFRNYFVQFLRIFRDKLMNKLDTEDSLKLIDIANNLPNEIYKEQFINMAPLMESVVMNFKEKDQNSEKYLELVRKIESLPEIEGKEKLLNVIAVK